MDDIVDEMENPNQGTAGGGGTLGGPEIHDGENAGYGGSIRNIGKNKNHNKGESIVSKQSKNMYENEEGMQVEGGDGGVIDITHKNNNYNNQHVTPGAEIPISNNEVKLI